MRVNISGALRDVNQPDVLADQLLKGRRDVEKGLSAADFCRLPQPAEGGCFGPGTGVFFRHGRVYFVKILVIDDHVLIRGAFWCVLKELKGDTRILAASSCRQTNRQAKPSGGSSQHRIAFNAGRP